MDSATPQPVPTAEEKPTAGTQDQPVAGTDSSLRITERAAKVMRAQLEKRGTPEAAIRFGIRGGGCTGYSYMFQFEDRGPRANDCVVDAFGTKVLVDPKSLLLVKGTLIDFETGIRGHGFRFDNPNVQQSCGCGESISF